MDCLVVLLEKSTSTWIRKWSFLLLWSRTEHIFLITNRWWVKRCGVAINQEVPPRTFVSALSVTCLSQGVTTSSIMTDSTMCLGLVSCHSYSNSLRHATFSRCLNPSQSSCL